jgi:hypothetical protein
MDRARTWVVLVGVALVWAVGPAVAWAGVYLTLATGLPGGTAVSEEAEFWFDTPHGPPPPIAIKQVTGGVTVEAGTAGGTAFFGGAAVPVLLSLADGSAYVAAGGPPADTLTRRPGGGSGPLSSDAPKVGSPAPSDAAMLGITVADPAADGTRLLTVLLTDSVGETLATGSVTVPDAGWWVIGLGPGERTGGGPVDPPPPPVDPPPPPVDPPPPPVDPPPPGGGPVATPEPSTMALVALGGLTAGLWRRVRSRAAA